MTSTQKPIAKPFSVGRTNWTHPNGTAISEGDRDLYRAVMKTGEMRVQAAISHREK
jgi:hypothetical protein